MSILEGFLSAAAATPYKPKHLPEDQIQQESSGKQTGPDGKALVGRYRDGSMPKPSQRAYGVSQIQVATARETAKKHGIPWDEQRLMSDRDYNLQLGDLHQGDLNEYYKGDRVKAKAAYHSGTGTVDRAIQQYGDNWTQGLGPHGKEYIGAGGGNVVNRGTGNGDMTLDIPAVLRETGRAEGAGPTTSQVMNPNAAGATIKGNFEQTAQRAQKADDVLQGAITALDGVQSRSMEALQARNERVDEILNEEAVRTQEVMARVQPLFQQKAAIVQQKAEVVNMNPLVRAFKGLFDRNYDPQHLAAVEGSIDSQLQLHGEEYKTMLGLQDTLVGIVEKSFQGVTMENQLEAANLSQDVELASKSLAASSAIWNVNMEGLSADATLRTQQIQMTDQVLSELTPGQISTYHEQAKKSPGGIVTVNGANISEGQLLAASQRTAQQQVQLQQMEINNRSQNIALQEKAQEDLIGTMTTSQIRAAINAGGQFQGQTLKLDALGRGLQQAMGRDELMVQGTVTQGGVDAFNFTRKSIGSATQVAGMRALQLTGGQPSELMQVMSAQNPEVAAMMAKIQQAPPDQRDALARTYLPRLQQMGQQRSQAIDRIATNWAGSNPALKPLATAFLSGSPLNGEDSAKGIVALIRGGNTFGTNLSPEANAAINAAKGVIAAAEAKKRAPGQSAAALMAGKTNSKEAEEQLIRDVSAAISTNYAGAQFSSTLRTAPEIAKRMGHLGAKINPGVLREAMDAGSREGDRRIGIELGLNPDQVKQMFSQGESSPLWQKVSGKANGRTLQQMGAQRAIQQSMVTSQYLDNNHPKIGNFTAGRVYADLLSRPQFADAAGKMSQQQGQGGFGDFVISSMTQGAQTAKAHQYGQVALSAYNALNTNRGMKAALQAQQFNNDPIRKTATVLGAIPDLNAQEEQMLMAAITPIAKAAMTQNPSGGAAAAGAADFTGAYSGTNMGFDAATNAIVNGKFQDPILERIRQKAARNFGTYARVTEEAFDRFGNYSPEAEEE